MPVAIVAAAAVAGMAASGGDGGSPSPRNYAQETRDTLRAQVEMAPELYQSEAEFRPKYDALQQQEFQNQLLGTPAGTREEKYLTGYSPDIPGHYKEGVKQIGKGVPGSTWVDTQPGEPIYAMREVATPATKGMLDLYGEDIAPKVRTITAADATAQRSADLYDVTNLGPQAVAALRGADPANTALVDRLTGDAQSELDMGSHLDPGLQREFEQSVRSGKAARGFGFGPADLYEEASTVGSAGQALRDARRKYAQGIVGLRQGLYGDRSCKFWEGPAGRRRRLHRRCMETRSKSMPLRGPSCSTRKIRTRRICITPILTPNRRLPSARQTIERHSWVQ